MDYQSAVIDFLSKKENFEFALDISNNIEKVKCKLHLGFLKKIKECLDEKLTKSDKKDQWEIIFNEDIIMNKWEQVFSLRPILEQPLYLQLGIQQQEDFNFVYGICWNKNVNSEIYQKTTIIKLTELFNYLKKKNYETTNWWVGKIRALKYQSKDYYLKKVVESGNNLVENAEEIANELWKLFEEKVKDIEEINSSKPLDSFP
jgi:hypothetical protein